MFNLIYQIIRTIRPRQWLKNLSVFAAPVFHGYIFDPDILWLGIKAFLVFCTLSSAAYIVNDIVDAPKDILHPVKKNRPIASGKLPIKLAKILAIIFYSGGLIYAYFYVGRFFTAAALIFILLQFSYSFYYRNVIILDALVVASAFVLRVFAGGLAVNISISSWLILATIGLSLLMAFGKRRSEKTLLSDSVEGDGLKTRRTLRKYPDTLLDSMISMSASFCILSYSLFTFQISPQKAVSLLDPILPSILKTPKWMMLTIPIVIYGVARYLYVIYEKKKGESPARVLLSDKPLLATVTIWGLAVLGIIYLLPGS